VVSFTKRRQQGGGSVGRSTVLETCSGCFLDLRPWGLPREPTVPETVAAGADVVTFSGDKLLGGPQAGIVVGRQALVERLRKNPLNRALRIDKLTLAALRHAAGAARTSTAPREIHSACESRAAVVRRRALRVLHRVPAAARTALGLAVVAGRSEVGGGALPLAELPTAALVLGTSRHPAEALDAQLRAGSLPVIGRIAADRLLLDCRTVMDDEVPLLAAALTALV
jgi:L-seryl-tRNA(Ser) seleniumtransferase